MLQKGVREVQHHQGVALDQLEADHMPAERCRHIATGLGALLGLLFPEKLNIKPQKFAHHIVLEDKLLILTLVNEERLLV